MRTLHIVQGGIENGDKNWLERAAREGWTARSWIVPKSVAPGDDVVIYVGRYGFFATGKIKTEPRPRKDWPNRYGAAVNSVKLIKPAISLAVIQRRIPELAWARYPRSITTPTAEIAGQIREIIGARRKSTISGIDLQSLNGANLDELREAAIRRSRPTAPVKKGRANYRIRSRAIARYVLARSEGNCEGCAARAPFRKADGSFYLEPHHTHRVSDDGPDHPAKVIALCPNCHRRAHYSDDARKFNNSLKKRLANLEHHN